MRALVEHAGGWELCGWFSNFSLKRPLEKSAAALVMITVLARDARPSAGTPRRVRDVSGGETLTP